MFYQDNESEDLMLCPLVEEPAALVDGSFTYEDLVKDLIIEEKAYIRELHMIRKVKFECCPYSHIDDYVKSGLILNVEN